MFSRIILGAMDCVRTATCVLRHASGGPDFDWMSVVDALGGRTRVLS
jgi:hypothetical protein